MDDNTVKMNNEKYDEYYEYLDELRESGRTNMFGARPYLIEEYPELGKVEAGMIVASWMQTFGERHETK